MSKEGRNIISYMVYIHQDRHFPYLWHISHSSSVSTHNLLRNLPVQFVGSHASSVIPTKQLALYLHFFLNLMAQTHQIVH